MSGNRSYHSSNGLGKRTIPCTMKTKPQFSKSHVDHHLQRNQDAQNQNLTSKIYLSAILKNVSSNVLKLVSDETQSNCKIHRAKDNHPQLHHVFEKDAKSQVHEMLWCGKDY